MRYWKFIVAVAFSVPVLLSSNSARALPLIDFASPDSGMTLAFSDLVLGYEFTVSDSITVDGIGLFDNNADGLQSVHHLVLWNNTDPSNRFEAVTGMVNPDSSTANSDLSESGLGTYVYESVSPVVLDPGDYVLAATYQQNSKDMIVNLPDGIFANPVGSPDAVYKGGVFAIWTQGPENIDFPAMGGDWFGPALRIAENVPIAAPLTLAVTVAIPEPLTLALMVIGIAGIGVGRRQRS
jgi:hypothetical protein